MKYKNFKRSSDFLRKYNELNNLLTTYNKTLRQHLLKISKYLNIGNIGAYKRYVKKSKKIFYKFDRIQSKIRLLDKIIKKCPIK